MKRLGLETYKEERLHSLLSGKLKIQSVWRWFWWEPPGLHYVMVNCTMMRDLTAGEASTQQIGNQTISSKRSTASSPLLVFSQSPSKEVHTLCDGLNKNGPPNAWRHSHQGVSPFESRRICGLAGGSVSPLACFEISKAQVTCFPWCLQIWM